MKTHEIERAYNAAKDIKWLADLAVQRGETVEAMELSEAHMVVLRYAKQLKDKPHIPVEVHVSDAPRLDATGATGPMGKITKPTR